MTKVELSKYSINIFQVVNFTCIQNVICVKIKRWEMSSARVSSHGQVIISGHIFQHRKINFYNFRPDLIRRNLHKKSRPGPIQPTRPSLTRPVDIYVADCLHVTTLTGKNSRLHCTHDTMQTNL